jgi:hypothetical protein
MTPMPASYFQVCFADRINHVQQDDSGRLLRFREGERKIQITRDFDGRPLTAISTHPIEPTQAVEFLYNPNGHHYDTRGSLVSEVMLQLMHEARKPVNFEKVVLHGRSLAVDDLFCVIVATGITFAIPNDAGLGINLAGRDSATIYFFQSGDDPVTVNAGAGVTLTGVAPSPAKFRMTKIQWTWENTWAVS